MFFSPYLNPASYLKFKKPYFGHFLNFGGKKKFFKNSGSVPHNIMVSSSMPKFRET